MARRSGPSEWPSSRVAFVGRGDKLLENATANKLTNALTNNQVLAGATYYLILFSSLSFQTHLSMIFYISCMYP